MAEMTDSNDGPSTQMGTVKWFDPVKGFGFIVADEGEVDILLHVNVLRNFGQSSIADGSRVALVAQKTDRGVQATEVISITPPEGIHPSLPDLVGLDESRLKDAPLEASRVKWFDKGKGFGFANVFGRSDDVFVHIDVLRQSGLSDLQPGEAIAMRVIDGKRGLMAVEIKAWEQVVTTDGDFS